MTSHHHRYSHTPEFCYHRRPPNLPPAATQPTTGGQYSLLHLSIDGGHHRRLCYHRRLPPLPPATVRCSHVCCGSQREGIHPIPSLCFKHQLGMNVIWFMHFHQIEQVLKLYPDLVLL